MINTDMIAAMKPEARRRLAQTVPLKRIGETKNITQAAAFIFENDYFHGSLHRYRRRSALIPRSLCARNDINAMTLRRSIALT